MAVLMQPQLRRCQPPVAVGTLPNPRPLARGSVNPAPAWPLAPVLMLRRAPHVSIPLPSPTPTFLIPLPQRFLHGSAEILPLPARRFHSGRRTTGDKRAARSDGIRTGQAASAGPQSPLSRAGSHRKLLSRTGSGGSFCVPPVTRLGESQERGAGQPGIRSQPTKPRQARAILGQHLEYRWNVWKAGNGDEEWDSLIRAGILPCDWPAQLLQTPTIQQEGRN
ncbi:hypothetical protein COCON_G00124070 [Conger conger]|uniref:Uncharacterized protein n=1 Tax=Conger conger TaxID=82655 RepID=A0A9Q1HYE6_CONCO|nr:hypothetical protein COCON_G00124070 [Conger conger]